MWYTEEVAAAAAAAAAHLRHAVIRPLVRVQMHKRVLQPIHNN